MAKFKSTLFPQNKSGWIRIVEAFVAVLLIAGVVLVVLDKGYIGKEDISSKVYNTENAILRDIQLNDSLRQEILNEATLPVEWMDFPDGLRTKIENDAPDYLQCEARICSIGGDCGFSSNLEKDIYASATAITATQTTYDPRQLKIFCWMKN